MESLILKHLNRKVTPSFAPRPLIFKLLQEVLKFNAIYMSWSSPKTDLLTNFLKLRKSKSVLLNSSLDILLLNNRFISIFNLFIYLIELKAFLCLITYLFIFLTYLFL